MVFTGTACHSKRDNSSASSTENSASNAALPSPAHAGNPLLTAPFEHRTSDLDGMIKRREIRALVVYSRSAFFYDHGQPKGTAFEALEEFQRILNSKLKTGNLPVTVTFLPVGYDQLEQALLNGSGDLVAIPVAITPEREQKVTFSVPIAAHVKQVVVTGPTGTGVTNLDELSGRIVFVNPLSVYSQSLHDLNKMLESNGERPVIVRSADQNLGDEDLLEMANAGLIPATVTTNFRAMFWAKVFDHLHLCSKIRSG
jgi:membrane-bound lytic murein transglycosylase MltF